MLAELKYWIKQTKTIHTVTLWEIKPTLSKSSHLSGIIDSHFIAYIK